MYEYIYTFILKRVVLLRFLALHKLSLHTVEYCYIHLLSRDNLFIYAVQN